MATKIINASSAKVRFDSLKQGDTFLNTAGEVRIKTKPAVGNALNAVSLVTGDHYTYSSDQMVKPVDLIVEVH